MQLPPAFNGFVEHSKRVSPTCLISFERIRYSVPASFANRPVSLRVYPDQPVVAAEGNILCEHVRVAIALNAAMLPVDLILPDLMSCHARCLVRPLHQPPDGAVNRGAFE